MIKRKRKGKNSNYYFTDIHEKAIIEYCKTKDIRERNRIYVEIIKPTFSEMVDKIIFTYKFVSLPDIESLKSECKTWLMTMLDKFNPDRGSKAFSYFSVISKNWFIHQTKKIQKSRKQIPYELFYEENEEGYEPDILEKMEKEEYMYNLYREMFQWGEKEFPEEEKKVLKAIKVLFLNIDKIEIYNKKAVYLYIREMTGMNSKQLVLHLNRIRKRYNNFKRDWNNTK